MTVYQASSSSTRKATYLLAIPVTTPASADAPQAQAIDILRLFLGFCRLRSLCKASSSTILTSHARKHMASACKPSATWEVVIWRGRGERRAAGGHFRNET